MTENSSPERLVLSENAVTNRNVLVRDLGYIEIVNDAFDLGLQLENLERDISGCLHALRTLEVGSMICYILRSSI